MDRIALRENQNNNFDLQPTLKNQLNSSLLESDVRTGETTKENYNPKSLSEIAADKTTKVAPFENSNTTSTPKTVRKESLKERVSSDFDLDYSIDIQPKYPREPFQGNRTDVSLSFLTEGLNKLGLEGSETPVDIDVQSNTTFSDDEEQFVECQSFYDSSSRFASVSAASRESVNNFNVNQVINIEATDWNDTLKNDGAARDGNQTFDADGPKINQSETLSNDKTFENVEQEVLQADVKIGESFTVALPKEDLSTDSKEIASPEVSQSSVIEVEKVTFENFDQEVHQDGVKMGESFTIASSKDVLSTDAKEIVTSEVPVNEVERATFENVEQEQEVHRSGLIMDESITIASPNEVLSQETKQIAVPEISQASVLQIEKVLSLPLPDHNVSMPEMMDISMIENEKAETCVKEILSEAIITQEIPPSLQIEMPEIQEISSSPVTSPAQVIESEKKEISPVKFTSSDVTGEQPSKAELSYHNIDEFPFKILPAEEKNQGTPTEKRQESPLTIAAVIAKSRSPSKKDENVFVEKMESSIEVQFKMPAAPVFKQNDVPSDEEFKTCGSSYNFNESDFDYLQNAGSDKHRWTLQRDSILSRFDPLLAQPNDKRLTVTQEEDDYVADFELKLPTQDVSQSDSREEINSSADNTFGSASSVIEQPSRQVIPKEDDMNCVDIMKDISVENKISDTNHIEGEVTKLSSHRNEENGLKMAELENKVKKEAEMREEALLKRISEKDKQIAKMNGVVEAYEKAISELIAEKEQLVQSYEKKCSDLKSDSELNANHLASLEATFSDLHAKYERTKQVAVELKDREEGILQDRKTLTDSLKMQEARYDKMKAHAMSQLEIANSTLAEINRNHQAEVTKLKALLKKEEISRASVNEQLIQKAKENSELVKICDELINGTQSS